MKFFVGLTSCILLGSLMANVPPPPRGGAGIIERQLEKEYEATPLEPEKQIPQIEIDLPKERLQIPVGKKVLITSIHFQGNTVFTEKKLCEIIQGCINRELSLQDIYGLCHQIDEYYAKKGYFLARAYPPPQKIENGMITLEIIEGKLGNIQVSGNQFYKKEFILKYFDSLKNQPLQYDDFLKALLLLNDNMDLKAGAVFEKGQESGTADIIVRVEDKRPYHLYFNGNDYGKYLTTNFRLGGRFDAGSLLAYGDKLSIAEVLGFPIEALYFTDVVYSIPLNKKGTFLELSYLFSKFKVHEFSYLHLKGRSDIATIKALHAISRGRFTSSDCFASFDFKQIENYALGSKTSHDRIRLLTLGTYVDHFNPKNGRDYATVKMGIGIPHFLGGMKKHDCDSSRPCAGGQFFKLNVDYDRLQILPKNCFFYLHFTGQWSPNKLTLPEQIYIGGSDTVRGFPLASALGDSGYYFNCEFRFPPPFIAQKRFFMLKRNWEEVVQFIAFLDQGGVFLHDGKDTFDWGAGFGIRINGPYKTAFSVDVGFPLNHRDISKDWFVYFKVTENPF
jgi:hemolysin activation/secretion protein